MLNISIFKPREPVGAAKVMKRLEGKVHLTTGLKIVINETPSAYCVKNVSLSSVSTYELLIFFGKREPENLKFCGRLPKIGHASFHY